MANTLYEYYTGQGQALPSLQERSKLFESSGLGNASLYKGTAEQNTALLGTLQKPKEVSPVSSISSGDAVTETNKNKEFMDTTYPNTPSQTPQPQAPEPVKSEQEKTQQDTGKAIFVNSNGQEMELTEEQLKNTETVNFLKEGGFVVSKSSFPVSGDFSTSKLQNEFNQKTEQLEQLITDFQSYNVDQDPDFKNQAEQIKAEFAKARREMEKVNFQRKRAFETLGFRTGATQYADNIQMGIEGEELSQANERISEITRQESAAISAARAAFRSGKYEEYDRTVKSLKDLRDMKGEELKKYNEEIAKVTKRIQEESQAELDNLYKKIQIQKAQQEIVQSNLDAFASGFVDFDEAGNIITAEPEDMRAFAEESGIPYEQIVGAVRKKAYELGKMSQEDKLRELNISKAQKDLVPQIYQEYDAAVQRGEWNPEDGGAMEYYAAKERAKENPLDREKKALEIKKLQQDISNNTSALDREKKLLEIQKLQKEVTEGPAPTAAQNLAAGFATRIEQSLQNMNDIEDSVVKKLTGKYSFARNIPDRLKDGEVKQQIQAEENFINAILRRESGAAISDSEYNRAATQYFPQAGDTEAVLKQKKQNRQAVLDNLKQTAGSAYQPTSLDATGNTVYKDINDFISRATTQEVNDFSKLKSTFPNKTPQELFDFYMEEQDFNQPLSMGQKGSRVDKLAAAIAQHETGNVNKPGATGELATRYQFMPATWKSLAKKYLGNANAPTTDKNQDKVAKAYISDLFAQGYDEREIAMIWNGGVPRRKVGTTKTTSGKTISYDTGRYADSVLSIYNKLS